MSEEMTALLTDVRERSKKINPTLLIKREFVNVGEVSGLEETKTCNGTERSGNEDCFRVMQWNLLAQGLCQSSDGFILCPPQALDWNFRQLHMIEELLAYTADIYCLEEVDHFAFISEHLEKLGFKGCFCPKPDSPCLYQANNNGPDGCAIFWHIEKFQLLHQRNVILQDDRHKETNQVALMCKFRGLKGHLKDKEFICVTTHFKSKTGYDDLRYQQAKFLETLLQEATAGVPIILCGDFNADPQSEAVRIIKTCDLGLKSAYTLLSYDESEPPYTTWKVRAGKKGQSSTEVCHTIDYLFYSVNHFKVVQLLKLPSPEEIGPGFLPSYSYPSDHMSLVADLKLVEANPA